MAEKINGDLKQIVLLLKDEGVAIDPGINKLHYLLTSYFLIVSSLVISAHYIGNAPISCSAKLTNPGKWWGGRSRALILQDSPAMESRMVPF